MSQIKIVTHENTLRPDEGIRSHRLYSSPSVSFCWVYHGNVGYWSLLLPSMGLDFLTNKSVSNVSDLVVLSGIDTGYSANIPVSSPCTLSLNDHKRREIQRSMGSNKGTGVN